MQTGTSKHKKVFTGGKRYDNIKFAANTVAYTYSSGDRAPPSGGGCGGSNPPRCVKSPEEIPLDFFCPFLLASDHSILEREKHRRRKMEQIICIDIGGTAIKYGIIANGDVQFQKEMATEAAKGGPEIMKKVKGIVGALESAETAGVAISTAGMVDPDAGRIFYAAPLIPDYTGTEFKKEIEEEFSLPCEVENDVNCACLAEYESGAGRGAKMALMLTVGTGIGGCCIMDGKVLHGA